MSKYMALLLLILTKPKISTSFILWAVHTTNNTLTLTFKKKYINLILLSLYKGSWRNHGILPPIRIQKNGNNIILCIFHYFFKRIKKHDSHHPSFWSLMGWRTTWKRKNIWCWNKEILLCLFCKYSWVLNIILGFNKYYQFVLPYCQYMVVYRPNLANMLHNSVIIQSILRITNKI